jgi:hypothetical protein
MVTDGGLPPSHHGDLLNHVVRMVTPMRREFGFALDVANVLRNVSYAREVIERAKTSQDARLREYADYLELKIFGPRNGPATRVHKAGCPAVEPPEPAAKSSPELESEMRERMLRKYKSGLR